MRPQMLCFITAGLMYALARPHSIHELHNLLVGLHLFQDTARLA
jgi:hypothetical protein